MQQAFICDAVRTPFGRFGGALAAIRADDLAALPIRALMERHRAWTGRRWRRGVRLRQPGRRGQPQRGRMAALLAAFPRACPARP